MRKNIFIKTGALACLALVIAQSCSKDLNLTPTNDTTSEVVSFVGVRFRSLEQDCAITKVKKASAPVLIKIFFLIYFILY